MNRINDSNYDITFGIPMYNSEKYINHLLDCFCETDSFNYEILIVDDGSTDKSAKICLDRIDLPIRLIKQKNSGVSSARNRLIEESKGKYITFVDSDDLIVFDEYIKSFHLMKSINADLFISSKKCDLSKLIENEIINSPCMKIYSIDLLKKHNIIFNKNISLGEDLLFNLNYYKICTNICFYDSNMYYYRKINEMSLTTKYRKNKFEELMLVNEECKKLFNKHNIYNSLEYIRIKNCLSCLKSEISNPQKTIKNNLEYIKKIKKYKKYKIQILNNFKTTCIYNLWYMLPSIVLLIIVRLVVKVGNKV